MRQRLATVVVILALTALAAAIGWINHPPGSSEFGDMGFLRGRVLICHTSDRCAVVHPRRGQKMMVLLHHGDSNSAASISGRFGVAREGTFSGMMDPGTYRATLEPATFHGLRAETVVVTLSTSKNIRLNLAYR